MIGMSYISFSFLLFLAVLMTLYLLMPSVRLRQIILLAGNLVFYICAGGRSLLAILIATTFIVYAASRLMGRVYEGFESETAAKELKPKEKSQLLASYRKRAKAVLIPSLVIVLGILVYGKAGKLIGFPETSDFSSLAGAGFRAVMVPLGISYYTFSAVGYLLDIYWRKTKAEKNPLLLLLSMTYFPVIIQGPISRYDRLMKQFGELPGFSYERVTFGLQRAVFGFFKKLVLADRISAFPAAVFGNIQEHSGLLVVLAVCANAVHLYMDFSGCMDIVIGISEALGVTLDENFSQPFFSKSAAEFWRRWHITLGSWFKDYVYMPIATSKFMMNRTSAIRKSGKKRLASFTAAAVPLIVVWILTGLWHGTGADYLLWGVYWGVLIILETAFAPEWKKLAAYLHTEPDRPLPGFLRMVRTFVYFCFGRMITALGCAGSALIILRRIFSGSGAREFIDGSVFTYGVDAKDFAVIAAGLFICFLVSIWQTKMHIRERIAKMALPVRWAVYLAGIMAVVIFGVYGPGYSASSFVYGAF